MKTFVIKIMAFSIIILTSFVFVYAKRPNLFVEKFTKHSNTYDIINLGTSHGANIDYGALNGKSFQRAGNTLYYDLQNYKYLKPHLSEDAVVIIPVSYFSFGLDENRSDYGNSDAFVNNYYMFLPKSSIFNYSIKKHIQVHLNKVKENYHSVINERFFRNKKKVKDTLPIGVKLENHAKKRVETHKAMALYSDSKKNVTYLKLLIEEIINAGHTPVLLTMPYADNYTEKFSDVWLNEQYYKHLNMVKSEYNVPYLNYSKDLRIIKKDSFFSNSDHLNQNGRLFFSSILFEDLREIEVLKNE